jgi:hypothetical protein
MFKRCLDTELSIPGLEAHMPLMLLPNQNLLLPLQPLQLDLFLGNELYGELTGLLNNPLIVILLSLAAGRPLNQIIEYDTAGINILGLEQLMRNPNLAHDDGMHLVHFEHFPGHELELGSCDPFLDHRVGRDVEVGFVQVFPGLLQRVLVGLGVVGFVQGFLQLFRLLQ